MTIDDDLKQVQEHLDNSVKTYVELSGLVIDLAADTGMEQEANYKHAEKINEAVKHIKQVVIILSMVVTSMRKM